MSLLCGVFKQKELKKWGKRIKMCRRVVCQTTEVLCDDDFNIVV
jgi:hypothetical protein